MTCFFCNSLFHVSQNCDIYVSNESRQQIATSKNCCQSCLTYLNEPWCENCESKQKCFICFSKLHHTVYCPDRFTDKNLFPPNLSKNLFLRFLKLLKFEEKYFIIFSYPYLFETLELEPLKVICRDRMTFPYPRNLSDFDLVVVDQLNVRNDCDLKDVTFRIRHLEIADCNISSKNLLQLLSTKTMTFKCGETKFLRKFTLSEIFEKAPNLELLDIFRTNVEYKSSWPEDLLQRGKEDKLQYLYLKIPDFNFNFGSLAALMKKKSDKFFMFSLYIDGTQDKKFDDVAIASEMVKQKFSSFFKPMTNEGIRYVSVTYIYRTKFWSGIKRGTHFIQEYVLKDP